jgi:hypothetical protein
MSQTNFPPSPKPVENTTGPSNETLHSPSAKSLGKRQWGNYNLDTNFYESFKQPEKKIKLDIQDDRKEALNARHSFTNLVSSASLILPPEIDTVVITREKFVVEWNHGSNKTRIPLTQITQILNPSREELVKSEIHQNSFNIPLYYCNSSTSPEISKKVKEEKRLIVSSQISDAETSLSSRLIERAVSLTKEAFKEKADKNKEKNVKDRLHRAIRDINPVWNNNVIYFVFIVYKPS